MDKSSISNIELSEVTVGDYPHFENAKIVSANYQGDQMNQKQLEELNKDSQFVYSCIFNQLLS